MRLIKRGAEGDIYQTVWNSKKSILKIRRPKAYRNAELDSRIRRQRTAREAEIICQAKSFGVRAPLVLFVNKRRSSIMMQHIPGTPVHEFAGRRLVGLSGELGRMVGRLHRNGIMHGDLTTSNFIASGKKIFIIDFGLAVRTSKPEDHAVDLRLFKEILNSAHVAEMEQAWRGFLSGYGQAVGAQRMRRITHLVSVIEGRGRYARVI